MAYTPVSPEEFAELDGFEDWSLDNGRIEAVFDLASFARAGALVAAIADAADALDHHPDVDLRYPARVHVTLTTHATAGLTTHDIDLAQQISRLAASLR
jgi:4a-hydroxytetrahydrobiopterin dehydratase